MTISSASAVSDQFVAGKNKFINGDFYWNQRNATSTTTNDSFVHDRWKNSVGSGGGTVTYSTQAFTPGTAPVAGYEGINYAQIVTASHSNTGDFGGLFQRIEDIRTLSGQTVTISFWAKAASGTPSVAVTLEQNGGVGGTTTSTPFGNVTLSTSWTRYAVTGQIPSVSGRTIGTNNNLTFFFFTSIGSGLTGYGTLGLQNATIGFWGMQIEAGTVATAFTTASGSIGGELALCQRYYQRQYFDVRIYSSSASANWSLPVSYSPMRISPTPAFVLAADYSNNITGTPTLSFGSANSINIISLRFVNTSIGDCYYGRLYELNAEF
jgi:hypothetical protein